MLTDRRAFLLTAALTVATLPTPVAAQEAGGQDIVVTGDLPEAAEIREATRQAVPGRAANLPVLRYHDPICLQVTGMDPRANRLVRDRIIRNLGEANVAVASPDCIGNAVVIVAADPATVVTWVRANVPELLPTDALGAVEQAAGDGDAVIAWHNTEVRNASGRPIPHGGAVAGDVGVNSFAIGARVNNGARARRIGANHASAITSAGVIFDMDALVGMDLERVADHATMRLLAPMLDARRWQWAEPESVVAPFDPAQGAERLTRFDRAFLRALYSMRPATGSSRLPAAVARAYADAE